MPDSRIRWWKLLIIGSVIALAAGCSALRVAYSSAPTLVWWQADGWLDTDRNQAPAVRAAIDRWFAWHRSTQIAPTVALLAEVREQLGAPITPETVCRYGTRVQALLEPALARALDEAAELVPLLTEANLKAMAAKGAQDLAEDREKFLQADPAERRAESLERTRKRYERLYGTLSDRQLAVLREGMAELPLDPERWLAEREQRQRSVVATLRRISAEKAPREQRLASLRTMLASPADPARQAQQQRLTEANCALAAKVHNAATPQQRSRAQANVKAWEDDLRSFLAAPAVTAALTGPKPSAP
jgi:hypothetical protein